MGQCETQDYRLGTHIYYQNYVIAPNNVKKMAQNKPKNPFQILTSFWTRDSLGKASVSM